MCLSFAEVSAQAALVTAGGNFGVSIVDYNQDGQPDIFLLKTSQPNELFRNAGGSFAKMSGIGLASDGDSRSAAWGDYDNDGNLDLALVGGNGTQLYKNNGGNFVSVAAPLGIHDLNPGKVAVWLGGDLLLATENGTRFYKNVGGNSFQEGALLAGLDDPGDGVALAAGDYDGDGKTDVYLANSTGANRLFHRLSNGTFESVENITQTVGQGNATDAAWVSHEGESYPSLYVSNWSSGNHFFINQQNGAFKDQAAILGINDPGQTTRVAFGDFLGEKRPALFLGRWDQKNLLYVPDLSNDAGKTVVKYTDRAYPLGMSVVGKTVGADWLDYDGDGKLDLLVVFADGGLFLYQNMTRAVKVCEEGL